MFKKGMRILLAAAAVAPILVSSAWAAGQMTIIVNDPSNPYWLTEGNVAKATAEKLGYTASVSAHKGDTNTESNLIDTAITNKSVAIILDPANADGSVGAVKKAVAAGIPVISMNSGSDVSKGLGALLHVGQDEYDAGKAAGAKLKEMGGKTGICVNHEVGNVALDLRCKGFADGFGGQVTVVPTRTDPSDIKAKVKASIASNAAIDTIMALSAPLGGEACVAAAKETGSKANIASFDLSPNFLKSIAAGEAAFGIDQQQFLQGYLPVVFLANYAKYGLIPGGNVPSGPNLITKDKAAQVTELSAKGIR